MTNQSRWPLYRRLDARLDERDAAAFLPLGQGEWSFDDLIVVLRGTQIPYDYFNQFRHPEFEVLR